MCGIAGAVFSSREKIISKEMLFSMINPLRHRGPDGSGIELMGHVGFAHRRLSIIDLSQNAKQPLLSQCGRYCITYNGEIYNYKNIREILISKGYVFRSTSDTEVLLSSFVEWGIDCISRLNGMFAFAIWDNQEKILHLVRDRLGIKPLFYYVNEEGIFFGSEIKSILASQKVRKEIDIVAMDEYLSLNYCQAPRTLFKNVVQLLPGERLVFKEGNVFKKKYWDIDYPIVKDIKSESYYLEKLDNQFEESIRLRMISDVPIGAFLSGGVDSSAISLYMSKLSSNPIKTFSIGFKDASFNELEYAELVARKIGAEHHSQIIDADAATILDTIVAHSEEPTADSSMIPMYYLSKLAKEHVTVVLSGDGADELFAGYDTYPAFFAARLYSKLPSFLSRGLVPNLVNRLPVSTTKLSLAEKLKRFVAGANLSPSEAHFSWRMICNNEVKNSIYSKNLKSFLSLEALDKSYHQEFSRLSENSWLDKVLYSDTVKYLPNDMLTKVDRMTMAHSLEARVPFLDHNLVNYAASIPDKYKLKYFHKKKYLLKKMLYGKLPPIVYQRKKAGFSVPLASWFRGDLKVYTQDRLLDGSLLKGDLFDREGIIEIFNRHQRGDHDYSHQLWGFLTMSIWYEKFFCETTKV